MRAARRGDRAAFAILHERFAPMVHGIALARAAHADAADIVQEVFLRALRSLDSLRDDAAIGPWLAALARNVANEMHRAGRARLAASQQASSQLREDGEYVGRVGGSDDREQAVAALAAIQALPDAYAETLVLRLVEGLTGPQIAACTGMTPGSVRVNLHRGMSLLRARLGDRGARDDGGAS